MNHGTRKCCRVTGVAIVILVLMVCIPITMPRLLGYQPYTVITGSMEPAIPTGSLIYTKYEEPETVKEEDVIAFYGATDGGAIITHRVVKNKVILGQFVTKGDANDKEDIRPVEYNNYIGKVSFSIPVIGNLAQIIASTYGKLAVACLLVFAAILNILASKES